jgi:hypothetical protein
MDGCLLTALGPFAFRNCGFDPVSNEIETILSRGKHSIDTILRPFPQGNVNAFKPYLLEGHERKHSKK